VYVIKYNPNVTIDRWWWIL